MSTIWPHSNMIEWDANGVRAAGALAYFYNGGTSTPRAVYQDAALDTPWTQPVVADGNGRWPEVFLDYITYKETITTAGNSVLWSTDNIPNPEPFTDAFTLDTTTILNTGDYIFAGANTTRAGAVRCNGRTIGNAASGATERANADTAALFAYLWNNYANGQAAVSTGRGGTAAADYAANKNIALPDHRSASLVGFDDMGNTAAALAGTAPVVSGSAILAGSIIGANTHTLTTAQLSSHTHTGTTATEGAHTHTGVSNGPNTFHTHTYTTSSNGAHTHAISGGTVGATTNTTNVLLSGGGAVNLPTGASAILTVSDGAHTHSGTTSNDDGLHTHNFTTGAGSAHSHTFTSDATGGATAHNIMARVTPVNIMMKL